MPIAVKYQNSAPDQPFVMPIGKHKGKLLADVPTAHIKWLLEQEFLIDYPARLWRELDAEYGRRLSGKKRKPADTGIWAPCHRNTHPRR